MIEQVKKKSAFKQGGMFNEANPQIFKMAKQLRRNMTHAETVLWMHLKGGVNGLKFRRQHPVGIYIADFYCHKLKLVIEIDGSIHNETEVIKYDINRENDLKDWGYKIIRFTNERTVNETAKVLNEINAVVKNLTSL